MMPEPLKQPLRLNPLAFPIETDTRFRLLLAAALALAITIGTMLPVAIAPDEPGIPMDLVLTPQNLGSARAFAEARATALHNIGLVLRYLAPAAAIIAGMALSAIVRYWLHPQRLLRRYQLRPLSCADDTRFVREVERLAVQAKIQPPPAIVSSKGRALGQSGAGQAFGLPGRYMLRLEGNLRLRLRKRPAEARAVVLHELAHIANRDISRTYGAEALWATVPWLTLAPLLLIAGFHFVAGLAEQVADGRLDISQVGRAAFVLLRLMAHAGSVLLIVALTRAGLLRARELYADWRVAHWGGAEGLAAVLRKGTAQQPNHHHWMQWAAWLRLHPTPAERLHALHDPRQLFRIAPDLALTVGILLGILALGTVTLLPSLIITCASLLILIATSLNWLSNDLAELLIIWAYPLAGLLLITAVLSAVYLLVGTMGVQIQQHALLGRLSEDGSGDVRTLWWTAANLSVGAEFGLLLVPISQFMPHTAREGMRIAFWLAGVLVIVWVCLAYTSWLSRRALWSYTDAARPIWRQRLLALVLCALLTCWSTPLGLIRVQLSSAAADEAQPLLRPVMIMVVVLAFLLSLAVVGLCEITLLLGRKVRLPRCSCGSALNHRMAGVHCATCGRTLWPWLITDDAEIGATASVEAFNRAIPQTD